MTEQLDRLNAALADRYEIERKIGQGGMATVYLAHDIKHDRKVAVKVLRPELAAVIGAERFVQEIKTTANLQHPHRLALFDSGEADSFLYYVMPLVEGETLRAKLDREKQLSVDEAIEISTAVAGALDYAHRHEVVHRDIKPENILLHDGQPVVADFGIALAISAAGGSRLTETGLSLGTPHYMSPEQATADRDLDARSDVYSLACVTYEMLVGEPPFTAPSAQGVVAKILTDAPEPITLHRKTVPPHVEATVAKALQKLPADRFSSAAEFAAALADPRTAPTPIAVPEAAGADRRRSSRWIAALGGAIVLSFVAGWMMRPEPTTDAQRLRFYHVPDLTHEIRFRCCGPLFAISRDGRRMVYPGAPAGERLMLYVRDFDEFEARPLPGTRGASSVFFSPDGEWVGFRAGRTLRKVSVRGGAPVDLAQLSRPVAGATWTDDDRIIFSNLGSSNVAPADIAGLFWIPADGGTPERLTTPDTARGENDHVTPHFVSGANVVLFTSWPATGERADARVAALSLESGEIKILGRGFQPRYSRTGHLMYAVDGLAVVAQRFDIDRIETTGPQHYLADSVFAATGGWSDYDVSETGTLIYLHGESQAILELVDRTGRARELDFHVDAAIHFDHPRFSPDGNRILVSASAEGSHRLYTVDLVSGTNMRLTFDGNTEQAEWSPNSDSIFFAKNFAELVVMPADRSGDPRSLTEEHIDAISGGFSVGRSYVATAPRNSDTGLDIVVAHRDSLSSMRPFIVTPFDEGGPTISPNGRWLAYNSNESGQIEVYVSPFPEPGGRQVVSLDGGSEVVWGGDGRTLYYRSGDRMIAATVRAEQTFTVISREVLFNTSAEINPFATEYDVHPSGEEFVLIRSRASGRHLAVEVNALAGLDD